MINSESDAHCCHMGTATMHPVPDRVKPSFVIFDIRALWRSAECQSARVSKITNDSMAQDALWQYPYDNSGRQKVNHKYCAN